MEQQQQQGVISGVFSVVIPGQPVITNFMQIDDSRSYIDVSNPGSVNQLTIFLQQDLPEGLGIGVFYSRSADTTNCEFIGAIGNAQPSDTFHTGWSLNPDLMNLPAIRLIFVADNLASFKDLYDITKENPSLKEYAKKVAQNLVSFMESFDQSAFDVGPNYWVLPNNILDRWYTRFEAKFKHDPTFVLRQGD
mmetsp:Transcript_9677/g.10632  ORF Transcript_9677/g.10632 Transcript_9677/m.10632 type:complete len:192 (+) Transcript_9677:135-710(+)